MSTELRPAERISNAEAFLREAVFRSRAQQGLETELRRGAAPSTAGTCGLGAKAAVVLDLSPEGERLARLLWPRELDSAEIERVHALMRAWVRAQDAHDRQRNHFLKAFRQAHGFDRRGYPPATLAEYETGLARIAAEEDHDRRAAAAALTNVR